MNCPLDFDILLSCALGELAEGEAEGGSPPHGWVSALQTGRRQGRGTLRGAPGPSARGTGRGVWAGVREAAEASRGSAASPDRQAASSSPRLLAGAAAAVSIAVLRFAFSPGAARRDAGLAVEEMGGTFARGDVEPFLRDLRAVVAETLRCAEAGDEACWLGVEEARRDAAAPLEG